MICWQQKAFTVSSSGDGDGGGTSWQFSRGTFFGHPGSSAVTPASFSNHMNHSALCTYLCVVAAHPCDQSLKAALSQTDNNKMMKHCAANQPEPECFLFTFILSDDYSAAIFKSYFLLEPFRKATSHWCFTGCVVENTPVSTKHCENVLTRQQSVFRQSFLTLNDTELSKRSHLDKNRIVSVTDVVLLQKGEQMLYTKNHRHRNPRTTSLWWVTK